MRSLSLPTFRSQRQPPEGFDEHSVEMIEDVPRTSDGVSDLPSQFNTAI